MNTFVVFLFIATFWLPVYAGLVATFFAAARFEMWQRKNKKPDDSGH